MWCRWRPRRPSAPSKLRDRRDPRPARARGTWLRALRLHPGTAQELRSSARRSCPPSRGGSRPAAAGDRGRAGVGKALAGNAAERAGARGTFVSSATSPTRNLSRCTMPPPPSPIRASTKGSGCRSSRRWRAAPRSWPPRRPRPEKRRGTPRCWSIRPMRRDRHGIVARSKTRRWRPGCAPGGTGTRGGIHLGPHRAALIATWRTALAQS